MQEQTLTDTTPVRVIRPKQKGTMKDIPNQDTLPRRVVYREDYGVAEYPGASEPLRVCVGLFYNLEGLNTVWYVCMVSIGMEIFARKTFIQANSCQSVRAVAMGWEAEVAHQILLIENNGEGRTFRASNKERLIAAIRTNWPANVPQDKEAGIVQGGETPLYASKTGAFIGKIVNGVWRKEVDGNIHFLRKPPAIAFEADTFDSYESHIEGFRVLDRQTNNIYTMERAVFDAHRVTMDRDFGRQYYVRLGLWTLNGKLPEFKTEKLSPPPDAQVKLDFD